MKMCEQLNEDLWKQAEILADRPYKIEVTKDVLTTGEEVYILENPELSGNLAQGSTFEEAREELDQARVSFIYFLLVDELDVPSPVYYSRSASTAEVFNLEPTENNQQEEAQTEARRVVRRQWAFA